MLTFEDVRQAAEALERAGAAVTMQTVRAKLGGHSMRDISRHYKVLRQPILDGAPEPTNGTHAMSATLSPPPAPEPAPEGELARNERYLGLALERQADLEKEMADLRVRAERFMPMSEVREFNRRIVGTERAIEAIKRDIAQYHSERSRLR